MRKLKLQMQISIDGYVAGPNGEMDWMVWNWDDEIKQYVSQLTDSIDTIVLGRKMTEGFINYWESVVADKPDSEEFPFANLMVNTPKYVFSKTLQSVPGKNVTVENSDLTEVINELKKRDGKDIIVYGGAGFVSSLIDNKLIDEFHLFVNPTAICKGLKIFNSISSLKLAEVKAFPCGITLLKYIS